ncbi:hypothetical protein B0H14DRAFT_3461545 [Mycena olivaceomarginata]|nr:hypothetical protein B0H14DRAFT_3461545 [Mycena olivaceomarginata]
MSQGQPQLRGRSSLPMLTAHHLFQSETEASADDKMLKPSSNDFQIDTTNVLSATLTLFWNSLYRTYIAPVNGGSNADSLLSDSFAKGVGFAGGVDWTTGLEAMLKDATVMGDFEVEGRGSVNSRKRLRWGIETTRPVGVGYAVRFLSTLFSTFYTPHPFYFTLDVLFFVECRIANVISSRSASRLLEYAYNVAFDCLHRHYVLLFPDGASDCNELR